MMVLLFITQTIADDYCFVCNQPHSSTSTASAVAVASAQVENSVFVVNRHISLSPIVAANNQINNEDIQQINKVWKSLLDTMPIQSQKPQPLRDQRFSSSMPAYTPRRSIENNLRSESVRLRSRIITGYIINSFQVD